MPHSRGNLRPNLRETLDALEDGQEFDDEFVSEACALMVVVLNSLGQLRFRGSEEGKAHCPLPYLARTSASGIAFNSPRS